VAAVPNHRSGEKHWVVLGVHRPARRQWIPHLSDDRIVWTDDRHGSFDIFLYDVAVCRVP